MKRYKQFIISAIFFAAIYACNKNMNMHAETFKGFQQPSNFPAPVYDLKDNPVTSAGYSLGKKLFYDVELSPNNNISCSSCHKQQNAFTKMLNDDLNSRNVLPIMNLAWNKTFTWDGGVFDLDLQPIAPITDHTEMNTSLKSIVEKLKNTKDYNHLFKQAFGNEGICSATILKALSQYMVMCVSSTSKYDSVIIKQGVFNSDEQKGYLLFKKNCSSCHKEPLFTDNQFYNNFFDTLKEKDLGRYLITLQDSDKFKFRTPTLRNIVFTSPYMHDGRFKTLNEVLDYYNNKTFIAEGKETKIELSDSDEQNIIAFLKTLDDKNFVSDKNLSE